MGYSPYLAKVENLEIWSNLGFLVRLLNEAQILIR